MTYLIRSGTDVSRSVVKDSSLLKFKTISISTIMHSGFYKEHVYLSCFTQLAIFLLLTITASAQSISPTRDNDAGWKKVKEKNGITVFTRTPEDSKFKEFKAVTMIHDSIEAIIRQLINVDSYTSWIDHVVTSYVIRDLNERGILTYSRLTVPWPFSDRDAATLMTVTMSENEAVISLILKPNAIPEEEDAVRLTNGKGKWHLILQPNGETKIIYQFYADPGGFLPAWVVNLFIVDGPFKTLQNLTHEIQNKN